MILSFPCTLGIPIPFDLESQFDPAVEIEAIEFVNATPSARRLLRGDHPITPWWPGIPERSRPAFHGLQIPVLGGTRGTPGTCVILETHGIGETTVLLWPREGTYTRRS